MKHFYLTLIFIIFSLSCSIQKQENTKELKSKNLTGNQPRTKNSSISKETPVSTETTEEIPEYPGVTIDEEFGIVEYRNLENRELYEKNHFLDIENLKIHFKDFTPLKIEKDNGITTRIKTKSKYTSFAVGVSKLLGEDSKQLFILTHAGVVCCSSFWIIDIAGESPRIIFRSEDYEIYRNGLEIFDFENDGIYGITIFDAAFRYMLDDCGACSPEPRAVFKYDKKKKKYLPAKGIQQDFVKENFERTESWIKNSFEKLKRKEEFEDSYNYHRIVRAHVVNLIYFGKEKKAWKIFDKYYPEDKAYGKKDNRAEIKRILRNSKFYQALKKS